MGVKNLFVFTSEDPLDNYVKRYIKKRLKNIYATDLGSSLFLEDVFFWDNYRRESGVNVGHYFSMKRVKKMIANHQTQLLKWLEFIS